MPQASIQVEHLSKRFRLGSIGVDSWRDLLRFGRPKDPAEERVFWALRDVSFEVMPGEVVGIVGRNGAGKSTLLKILSRITEPTEGRAVMRGRVASLLEVGTGFHPDLTGRENIYLNGAILGMKRPEIRGCFDQIVEFAEIGRFLETPVKRYSSGMYVRLAFAVAAHLQPEILVVDEVLAVGDAEFQRKCLGKMREVAQGDGRTVLFVSHNMNAVQKLCSSAVLLEAGQVALAGDVSTIVRRYLSAGPAVECTDLTTHPHRSAAFAPVFQRLEMTDGKGRPSGAFAPGETARLTLHLHCPQLVKAPQLSIGVTDPSGERIFAVANYLGRSELGPLRGEVAVQVEFEVPAVQPNRYSLDLGLTEAGDKRIDEIYSAASLEITDINYLGGSHAYFAEMGPLLVRSQWSARDDEKAPAAAHLEDPHVQHA